MSGPRSVFGRALWERRHSLLGWMGGAVIVGLAAVAAYPTVRDHPAIAELLDQLHPALLAVIGVDPATFSTGLGFVQAQLYTLIAPLLVLIFAVGAGASVTAADEEDGTADLLFALPVSRRRALLQGWSAVALCTASLPLALGVALALGNPLVDLGLSASTLVGLNVGLWLLGLFFAALATAAGAWFGRRAPAVAVASGVALASFLITGLGPFVPALRALSRWSPFSMTFGTRPVGGFTLGAQHLALAGASLALVVLAAHLFERRDLGSTPSFRLLTRLRSPRLLGARQRPQRFDGWLRSVYGKLLWERRVSIVFWALGLWGLTAATIGFWPTLRDSAEAFEQMIELVPAELFTAFGIADPAVLMTPAGFVSSRVYATVGLVLCIALAASVSISALGGGGRRGSLDLLLACPISRRRIALESFAAMATLVVTVSAGLIPVLWLGDRWLQLEFGLEPILAANVALACTALSFGALALLVVALTGRPNVARGVVAAVTLGGFLLNLVGAVVPLLEPVLVLSPLHWLLASGPLLTRGFSPSTVAALPLALLLAAAAAEAFQRRDIAV